MPPSYPAGSYPAQVVADGAVAYWRLGETSGTTAVDVIGGANGTISGGVTLAQPGALSDGDKAMAFDGTTGKIAVTPYTLPALVTLEAWMRTPGPFQAVLSSRVSGGNLYFGQNGTGQVFVYTTGPIQGGPVLSNNQWHHIVATNNGTTTTLYADGVQVAQGAQTISTLGPLNIGYDQTGNEFWAGGIDDVAIYPTALTPAQIAAHYAARTWKAFGPAYQEMRYRWCRYVAGQARR